MVTMSIDQEKGRDVRPLDDVAAWLEAGFVLRQKLIVERERLLARLAEIDEALASLPGDQDSGDSTPEKVRKVLRGVQGPLTAPQIIDALRAADPVLEPRLVHSALHRLVKRGEVLAEGDTGSRLYAWVKPGEANR